MSTYSAMPSLEVTLGEGVILEHHGLIQIRIEKINPTEDVITYNPGTDGSPYPIAGTHIVWIRHIGLFELLRLKTRAVLDAVYPFVWGPRT